MRQLGAHVAASGASAGVAPDDDAASADSTLVGWDMGADALGAGWASNVLTLSEHTSEVELINGVSANVRPTGSPATISLRK